MKKDFEIANIVKLLLIIFFVLIIATTTFMVLFPDYVESASLFHGSVLFLTMFFAWFSLFCFSKYFLLSREERSFLWVVLGILFSVLFILAIIKPFSCSADCMAVDDANTFIKIVKTLFTTQDDSARLMLFD